MSTFHITAYFDPEDNRADELVADFPDMVWTTASGLPDRVTSSTNNPTVRNIHVLAMWAMGATQIIVEKGTE